MRRYNKLYNYNRFIVLRFFLNYKKSKFDWNLAKVRKIKIDKQELSYSKN